MGMEDRNGSHGRSPRLGGDEAAAPGTRAELARLSRRARRRPWRTLGYALAARGARRRRRRAAADHLRLARRLPRHRRRAPSTSHAGRVLREWIAGTVFSDGQLRALIDEHGLHAALAARDSHAAVEALRDDLAVELGRDGRSALRLAITVRGDDPRRVYDTVDAPRAARRRRAAARPSAAPRARLRLELVDAGRLDTPLGRPHDAARRRRSAGVPLALPFADRRRRRLRPARLRPRRRAPPRPRRHRRHPRLSPATTPAPSKRASAMIECAPS